MVARFILISQAPAASPAPPFGGRSGARFAKLCGLDLADFLDLFDRINLLADFPGRAGDKGDLFPMPRGARAAELLAGLAGRLVILVGMAVAAAFGVTPEPVLRWRRARPLPAFAIAPHPSGVSHWWN